MKYTKTGYMPKHEPLKDQLHHVFTRRRRQWLCCTKRTAKAMDALWFAKERKRKPGVKKVRITVTIEEVR